MLLDRQADVKVTEGLVMVVAKNFKEGLIKLLLDKQGLEVKATEELVRAYAIDLIKG